MASRLARLREMKAKLHPAIEHSFADTIDDGETGVLDAKTFKKARYDASVEAAKNQLGGLTRAVRTRISQWIKTPTDPFVAIELCLKKGETETNDASFTKVQILTWIQLQLASLGYRAVFMRMTSAIDRTRLALVIYVDEDAHRIYDRNPMFPLGWKPIFIVDKKASDAVDEKLKSRTGMTNLADEIIEQVAKNPVVQLKWRGDDVEVLTYWSVKESADDGDDDE